MSDPDEQVGAWPAVSYERLPWTSSDDVPASRTARRRRRGPYEAAVLPPIADRVVLLPADVAALVDDAGAEVARFDAELGQEIAPFAAALLRSESAASSKIEDLTASAQAIAEAELHPQPRGNASLIVSNERAMTAALALAERIDPEAILAMHAALLQRSRPEIAGRWRGWCTTSTPSVTAGASG